MSAQDPAGRVLQEGMRRVSEFLHGSATGLLAFGVYGETHSVPLFLGIWFAAGWHYFYGRKSR